jgi:hypothetical protein
MPEDVKQSLANVLGIQVLIAEMIAVLGIAT